MAAKAKTTPAKPAAKKAKQPQPVPPVAPAPYIPKKWAVGLAAALLVIVVGLIVAISNNFWRPTAPPEPAAEVFSEAIGKLLHTKTLTQSVSNGTTSIQSAYDMSNVKDPKVNVAAAVNDSANVVKVGGYGTLQNDYIKYTSFGSVGIDNALDPIVNKWVQTRKNGVLARGVDQRTEQITDPRFLLFGDIIEGNFSKQDGANLHQYIHTNKIYAYDKSEVTTSDVGGQKVYVYAVRENIPKLEELNKKVAAIMGLTTADIQPALDGLGQTGTTKFYIGIESKELVRYTTTQDGNTVVGSFTDYDTTSLPQEPKAYYSWTQFQQKQSELDGEISSGSTAQQT